MVYCLINSDKCSVNFESKSAYWLSNVDPKCECHFQRSSMFVIVYALVTCRFPNSAYDAFDTLHLQCLQFLDELDDGGEKVPLGEVAGSGGGGGSGNDTLLVSASLNHRSRSLLLLLPSSFLPFIRITTFGCTCFLVSILGVERCERLWRCLIQQRLRSHRRDFSISCLSS